MPKVPELLKPINWVEVEAMAQRMAPADEIQLSLGLTASQFKREVKRTYKKSVEDFLQMHYARGRYLVRQAQFDLAVLEKNCVMLRWLGLQYLGQTAKIHILNKAANELIKEASKPSGFEFKTPEGQTIIMPSLEQVSARQITSKSPVQPHETIPIIEQILREEADQTLIPTPPKPEEGRTIRTVSAHKSAK